VKYVELHTRVAKEHVRQQQWFTVLHVVAVSRLHAGVDLEGYAVGLCQLHQVVEHVIGQRAEGSAVEALPFVRHYTLAAPKFVKVG
jgi:hypothetical protein